MTFVLKYVQPPGGDNPNRVVMERKTRPIEANSPEEARQKANDFLAGRAMISLVQVQLMHI
ncbi:MAG: hypothetical protein NTV60_00140 [Candidatus Kaiserbacteria bacterium]|nr:hypothetical protein [Candidatus Kaiserbacteria bacterium]